MPPHADHGARENAERDAEARVGYVLATDDKKRIADLEVKVAKLMRDNMDWANQLGYIQRAMKAEAEWGKSIQTRVGKIEEIFGKRLDMHFDRLTALEQRPVPDNRPERY